MSITMPGFKKKSKLCVCVFVYLCICVGLCTWEQVLTEPSSIGYPGTWVTGVSKPPNMGTWVLGSELGSSARTVPILNCRALNKPLALYLSQGVTLTQADLNLTVLLIPSECWDYKCAVMCSSSLDESCIWMVGTSTSGQSFEFLQSVPLFFTGPSPPLCMAIYLLVVQPLAWEVLVYHLVRICGVHISILSSSTTVLILCSFYYWLFICLFLCQLLHLGRKCLGSSLCLCWKHKSSCSGRFLYSCARIVLLILGEYPP